MKAEKSFCRSTIYLLSLFMLSLLSFPVAVLSGCRVQAGNPQVDKPKKPGTVTVALADAPVDELSNLYITVRGIAFAPEGTRRCLLDARNACADSSLISFDFDSDQEVDLLSLSDGRTQVLPFTRQLESGVYEGLRLFLTEGTPVRGVLKSTVATVPVSFARSPLGKLEFTLIEEFEVLEGSENQFIIHIDLQRSVQKAPDGSFRMIPFNHVIPSRLAARISGSVADRSITRICAYNAGGIRRPETSPPQQPPLQTAQSGLSPMNPPPIPPPPFEPRTTPSAAKSGPGIPDFTSSCDRAVAVSDLKNGTYDLRYLLPAFYILRAFKSDGTYSDTTLPTPLAPQESRVLDL